MLPETLHYRFDRFGRSYHLHISSADDLANALELDEALWVATSVPITTLRGDEVFFNLVDSDRNGRIRVEELCDAIRWVHAVLRDTQPVTDRSDVIRLDTVDEDHADGHRILLSARKMLNATSDEEQNELPLATIREVKAKVEARPVSEAGVVLPEAADDDDVSAFIKDAVSIVGGADHPSGKPGLNIEKLDAFNKALGAFLDWRAAGEPDDQAAREALYPLGGDTRDSFALLDSLRAKVDQYFVQCEAVALDETYRAQLPPKQDALAAADFADSEQIRELMKVAPIATPRADAVLDFEDAVNPFYVYRLAELRTRVIEPMLGRPAASLAQGAWSQVKDGFARYEAWLKAKPDDAVAKLGEEKMQAYREPSYAQAVRTLVEESHDTALQLDNIRLAEKLALYQKYLIELANNAISFPQLYDPEDRAIFERGSLIMDGRRFELAVLAENRAEHAKVADSSNMFVMYVEISGAKTPKPYELAVPVTSGGKGNLVVGKRGIFQTVDGVEQDARVMQIIENPISLKEAIVAPFKRIGGLITGKIEQLTGAAQKKLDAATTEAMSTIENAPDAAAAPPPPPANAAAEADAARNRGMMAGGILAAGGVALAAVGSALAYISKIIATHGPQAIVVGIGGALLAVLAPSIVLAWLKLRKRDLSAILEGSGWAVNARMRLSRDQAKEFTNRPPYPAGALGIPTRGWVRLLVYIVLLILAAAVAYIIMRGETSTDLPAPSIEPTVSMVEPVR